LNVFGLTIPYITKALSLLVFKQALGTWLLDHFFHWLRPLEQLLLLLLSRLGPLLVWLEVRRLS
jgi:hypothetical protein